MKKKEFKKISFFVDDLVLNGSKKRGFHSSLILMRWNEVVGDYFSNKTIPLKITFNRNNNQGTLYIGINEAFAPEINLEKDILIEKVNQIFGSKIITKLKLKNDETFKKIQKDLIEKNIDNKNLNNSKKKHDNIIKKIENNELKSGLKRLAINISYNNPD